MEVAEEICVDDTLICTSDVCMELLVIVTHRLLSMLKGLGAAAESESTDESRLAAGSSTSGEPSTPGLGNPWLCHSGKWVARGRKGVIWLTGKDGRACGATLHSVNTYLHQLQGWAHVFPRSDLDCHINWRPLISSSSTASLPCPRTSFTLTDSVCDTCKG